MSTILKAVDKTATMERKKEKRVRQIRITEKTYQELIKLGSMTDDFEDVIDRLLKEHKGRAQKD
jgi:hypothetical protein